MDTPEKPELWSQHEMPSDMPLHERKLVERVVERVLEVLKNEILIEVVQDVLAAERQPEIVEEVRANQIETKPPYWARWEYTPEEWELFDQLDWGSAKRKWWLVILLVFFGLVLSSGLLIRFLMLESQGFFGVFYFTVFFNVFLLMFIGLFVVVPRGRAFRHARRRHIARLNGQRRVTIENVKWKDQALWQAGLQVKLQDLHTSLKKVDMTTNPPALRLQIKPYDYISETILHVLVPHGYEEEARHLVDRFRAETIEAGRRVNVPTAPIEPE